MKYYLDVNAVVSLYDDEIITKLPEQTYVSVLTISEMFKNIEKNFDRQKAQFLYIEKAKIKVDWENYENILYCSSFNLPKVHNTSTNYTRNMYRSILISNNYKEFLKNILGLDNNTSSTLDGLKELVGQMGVQFNDYIFNSIHHELQSNKNYYVNKETYRVKKDILDGMLKFGLYEHKLSVSKYKKVFRKKIKEYNHSVDVYIQALISVLRNPKFTKKNDASDLFHLSYIDKFTTFVTNDKGLQEFSKIVPDCNIISSKQFIEKIT